MAYFTKRVVSMAEKTAGFSRDGKTLLLALTAEKVGAEITVTLLSSNLSPLTEGGYLLVLAGKTAKTALLGDRLQPTEPLPASLSIEQGLSALLLFAREGKTVPVAFGKSGKCFFSEEDLRAEGARFLRSERERNGIPAENGANERNGRDGAIHGSDGARFGLGDGTDGRDANLPYADEALATENYFEWEKEDEKRQNFRGAYDDLTGGDCQKQEEKTQSFPCQADENDAFGGEDGERSKRVDERRSASFFGRDDEQKTENPFRRIDSAIPNLDGAARGMGGAVPNSDGTVRGMGGAVPNLDGSAHGMGGAAPNATTHGAEEIPGAFGHTYFMRVRKSFLALLRENEEARELSALMPGSYFARVAYGEDGFFVAGLVTTRPRVEKEDLASLSPEEIVTICFGVPDRGAEPPESLKKICSFLPFPSPLGDGYWMLCQNPQTGETETLSAL